MNIEYFRIEEFGIILDEKIVVIVREGFDHSILGDSDPFVFI